MSVATKGSKLAQVSSSGRGMPSRIVVHGVGGIGKTSFAANAPGAVFLMSPGETGLETLIDAGQTKEVPHFPVSKNWMDVQEVLQELTYEEHSFKTLVIDAANGLEHAFKSHVCETDFDGDWGPKKWGNFNAGPRMMVNKWPAFLAQLDQLREAKRMSMILVCHSKLVTVANPSGPDYQQWQGAFDEPKLWDATFNWSDATIFIDSYVSVKATDKEGKSGKASGGTQRQMHTAQSASWAAKNRFGLPEEIEMGDSGEEAWKNFAEAMKEAKAKKGAK